MDAVWKKTTKAKVLLNQSRSLSQRPIQATVPLYGENMRNELELLGSGVLLRVESEVFLLTARHVLDALPVRSRYIAVGNNMSILDAPNSSTKSLSEGRKYDPFDLAYFRLGSSLIGNLGSNEPISMNDLDLENCSTSGQVYLIIGFPVSKQPRMPKLDASSAHPGSLGVRPSSISSPGLGPDKYSEVGLDPTINLMIDFDKSNTWQETGPTVAPDPFGHSGGGVWRLPSFGGTNPGTAKLAGIAVEWRRSNPKCIIATKIEHCLYGIATNNPSLRGALRIWIH